MRDIVLYDYWRSSASYRVRIGLNLLGLPFTAVPVDLVAGAQRADANLARNPQGLVPSLQIDGHTMTQSLAILEYLNEVHGAGWLPDSPAPRAAVRALAYAVAMDIHPVCNLRVAKFATTFGATMQGWMTHFIPLGLQGLESMLAPHSGTYCHGDTLSLADICLVPQIYNARRWGVDMAPYPRLAAIHAALNAVPAFAAAQPENFAPPENIATKG